MAEQQESAKISMAERSDRRRIHSGPKKRRALFAFLGPAPFPFALIARNGRENDAHLNGRRRIALVANAEAAAVAVCVHTVHGLKAAAGVLLAVAVAVARVCVFGSIP